MVWVQTKFQLDPPLWSPIYSKLYEATACRWHRALQNDHVTPPTVPVCETTSCQRSDLLRTLIVHTFFYLQLWFKGTSFVFSFLFLHSPPALLCRSVVSEHWCPLVSVVRDALLHLSRLRFKALHKKNTPIFENPSVSIDLCEFSLKAGNHIWEIFVVCNIECGAEFEPPLSTKELN